MSAYSKSLKFAVDSLINGQLHECTGHGCM